MGTKRITGDTPDPGHRNNKAKLIDGRIYVSLLTFKKNKPFTLDVIPRRPDKNRPSTKKNKSPSTLMNWVSNIRLPFGYTTGHLYNQFREQPISTRARQFAVGYTAASRAIEGNYLGAIGALRYWPKTGRTTTYIRRTSRRQRRRQRYTKSANYKRTRGSRIYRQTSTQRRINRQRQKRHHYKQRIPVWLRNQHRHNNTSN